MSKHQCLRGMRDLTPAQSERMRYIEQYMANIAHSYGYSSIRFPILESIDLFKKSIGIETDIVGQEMYVFKDKNDADIALRPEGTAGCLRSVLANGLIQRQRQKLYYIGPMFRRERPQKGRFRQFQHFGIETYGYPNGLIDVELILMTAKMWEGLQLPNITLEVNYLGSPASRKQYHKILSEYWQKNIELLTEDEKHRATHNPLRLLDSKNPSITQLIDNAPKITDALTDEEKSQYAFILSQLDSCNIPYIKSNRLVRGLDYYSDFIYEWVSPDLGAQSTICGGGRYDPLVASMGVDTPATGFAAGIDRIEAILTMPLPKPKSIYLCTEDLNTLVSNLPALEKIRTTHIPIEVDYQPGKLKNKIKNNQSTYFVYCQSDGMCKLISQETDTSQLMSFEEICEWYKKLGA